MSQISRKVDPLQTNYCVLARIVCIYFRLCGFYCCELINHRKARLMLAKQYGIPTHNDCHTDTYA